MSNPIEILPGEVKYSFARSSGPGGQNVNKRSTKAILEFDVVHSKTLTGIQKQLILAKSNRITVEGYLIIPCDESRSQDMNKKRALEILNAHLNKVAIPEVIRKKTKPRKAAVMRSVETQKKEKMKKASRKKITL